MTNAWILTVNHPDDRPPATGGYVFDEVGRSRLTLLSLGTAPRDPALAAGLGGTVVRDEVFEVLHDITGGSPDAPAAAAAVLDFDGPISDAVFAAAERGFTDRIMPILTTLSGCVRVLVLWQPATGAQVVVNLTDSLEALSACERAITSSELLPGEDPALLPGPDRVCIQTVSITEGAVR
jgi:hypothetical protein